MDHPFLKLLSHPNHIALATALLSGASHASLIPEYGKTRVQQMAKHIKYYQPGDKSLRALPCEHCGKGGICRPVW